MAEDFKAKADRAVMETRKALKSIEHTLLALVMKSKQPGKFTQKRVKTAMKKTSNRLARVSQINKILSDKSFEKLDPTQKAEVRDLVRITEKVTDEWVLVPRVLKMMRRDPDVAFKQLVKMSKPVAIALVGGPMHVMELVRQLKKGLQPGTPTVVDLTLVPALLLFSLVAEIVEDNIV
jgi:hypothetical protein